MANFDEVLNSEELFIDCEIYVHLSIVGTPRPLAYLKGQCDLQSIKKRDGCEIFHKKGGWQKGDLVKWGRCLDFLMSSV